MADRTVSVLDGAHRDLDPVVLRLANGANALPELVARVQALGSRVETLPAKTLLQAQDTPVRRPRYLISGWACRQRLLADGRRQIFDLVLPGEGVGVCLRPNPLAATTTVALTPVRLVEAAALFRADAADIAEALTHAIHAQADADERRALNQILRLGRLTALERLGHLFLELYDRLHVIGMVFGDRFPFPLTQETLADITGLSIVHVNRTLQELRRQDLVRVERGYARLPDRLSLTGIAGYEG